MTQCSQRSSGAFANLFLLNLFTFLKVSEGKMLMALSTISVAGRGGSQAVLCLVVVIIES